MPFDSKDFVVPVCEEIVLLDKMAEILSTPERWCQKTIARDEATCLMGALREAAHGQNHFELTCWITTQQMVALVSAMADASGIKRGQPGVRVAAFNDAPTTTHADILDLIARTRRKFE